MNADIYQLSHVSIEERVPQEERVSHELVMMRILKLRWMGMEEEAERMAASLRQIDPGCVLPVGPVDTD
jgi:hypothetical protein